MRIKVWLLLLTHVRLGILFKNSVQIMNGTDILHLEATCCFLSHDPIHSMEACLLKANWPVSLLFPASFKWLTWLSSSRIISFWLNLLKWLEILIIRAISLHLHVIYNPGSGISPIHGFLSHSKEGNYETGWAIRHYGSIHFLKTFYSL